MQAIEHAVLDMWRGTISEMLPADEDEVEEDSPEGEADVTLTCDCKR
jgi:hypothetical protein